MITLRMTIAQATLVRDLVSSYLDACDENAGRPGHGKAAADARSSRAILRTVRGALSEART